jgi:hypothetical protein
MGQLSAERGARGEQFGQEGLFTRIKEIAARVGEMRGGGQDEITEEIARELARAAGGENAPAPFVWEPDTDALKEAFELAEELKKRADESDAEFAKREQERIDALADRKEKHADAFARLAEFHERERLDALNAEIGKMREAVAARDAALADVAARAGQVGVGGVVAERIAEQERVKALAKDDRDTARRVEQIKAKLGRGIKLSREDQEWRAAMMGIGKEQQNLVEQNKKDAAAIAAKEAEAQKIEADWRRRSLLALETTARTLDDNLRGT